MKIGIVCSEYPPAPHGGIGIVNQVLSRALVKRGHQVRVIGVYDTEVAARNHDQDEGVEVWRRPATRRRWGWVKDRVSLFRSISQWSRNGEIDLVEVPDWGGAAAFWPRLSIPVVCRLHGSATYTAFELNRPIDRMTALLERRSLQRADYCASVSRYTAERTEKAFDLPGRVDTVLHNPISLVVKALPLTKRHNRVVFTGTLTEKKGIISLIKAWPKVLSACEGTELHILGKDGRTDQGSSMKEFLQSQLDARSARCVFFHGHVGRDAVKESLLTARVGVFPSYSEAFALAPLESMACGCPTIHARRGSGPELMRDGIDGLLIDPNRPEEIADSIVRLLTDDNLAGRLSESGALMAKRNYALDPLVKQNEEFYAGCIERFQERSVKSFQPVSRAAFRTVASQNSHGKVL